MATSTAPSAGSALLDRYCTENGRDPASVIRSIVLAVSYDQASITRDAIGEAIGAGFHHLILGLSAPYPADVAQWVTDELISTSVPPSGSARLSRSYPAVRIGSGCGSWGILPQSSLCREGRDRSLRAVWPVVLRRPRPPSRPRLLRPARPSRVTKTDMDILLIAGLWLDGSAWAEVVPELEALGHHPVALTLPGQGDGSVSARLDDQVVAVLAAVDSADDKVMVVGHSAACTMAWLALDARPDKVARVALIGGFPSSDGQPYADFFEATDGAVSFPGWGPFEGSDSADLDEEARRSIASAAIPVPEGITKGMVRLADERRFDVPVVVVCPEFTVDQAREWIGAGDVPELAKAKHLDLVDIDSGHWPMFTKPVELARILAAVAAGV